MFTSQDLAAPSGITHHQVDMFSPEAFLEALSKADQNYKGVQALEVGLVQSKIQSLVGGFPAGAPIAWSQCEDDLGIFTLDFGYTKGTPNPPTKGKDVQLDLVGVLSDPVTLDHVTIHTDWEGVPLYDDEKPLNSAFDDVLQYQMSWNVPTFAPEGDYVTEVKGVTEDGTIAFCVSAEFAF